MSSQPQLTNSMIFQDGYCTTNQLYIFVHRESRKPIVGSPERNASPGYAMVFETFCHWVTLSANKPSVRKPGYSRKPVNSMVFPTWWHFKNHIVSYCFILFGILGTEYFSKRRRDISIFKFSLPKLLGNAIQAVRTNGVEGPLHSSQIWILFTHCRNWRECHSDII